MFKKYRTLLVWAILININVAMAQPAKDFKTMQHVVEEWNARQELQGAKCDVLYYKAVIDPKIIDATIKVLRSKRIFDIGELSVFDEKKISITQLEQSYLIGELQKLKLHKWPEKMFPQSKSINPNEIQTLFSSYKGRDNSIACAIIYGFSKPIFLRNKTICLYLDEEQYGENNAQLTFSFYRINQKEWEEYADVYVHFDSMPEL